MRWREYPRYKESGVEWLGKVPENWHIMRLKYTSSLNDEVLSESTDPDYEIQYVDISSVDANEGIKKKEIMRFEEAPSRARRRVRDGDVIISTVRTYLRAIAPVHNPEENLIVSTGFAVVRPIKGVDSHFAAYALRAPHFVEAVVARSVGVSYPAVNASEIGGLRIALPPDSKQRAIAAFLDRETARIDVLIGKKQRQIELLQEKRAALISHAVTKGLNSNLKMKNSGVDWLGHIPMHWEVKRLKNVCSLLRDGTHLPPPRTLTGIPLLSVRNIVDGKLVNLGDDSFISEEDLGKLNDSFLIKTDDVVLAIVGATIGKVAIVEQLQPFHIQRSLAIFRPKCDILHFEFLSYFLQGSHFQQLLWRYISFSAQPGIYLTTLSNFHFPMPPLTEQRDIVKSLSNSLSDINALIAKIQESIDRLKEYRTALISAAVTGQIDVREEVA